jgi:hypothetical protein
VGDERAEAYLRLLAEAELRRAGDRLRGFDAASGTDAWSDPGLTPFRIAEGAQWNVVRAGRILAAAGALEQDFLDRLTGELHAAITVRSEAIVRHLVGGPGRWHWMSVPPGGQAPPARPAAQAVRVTPIGRAVRVASDRAPSALHLMSLVRTGTEAVITVVMRMHWPPDGSSTDLEITGAGPHHLPYDDIRAVDDQGSRYAVRFDGEGGTAAWLGVARLSPVPPRAARRLDLAGDQTRLIRLDLGAPTAHPRARPVREPVAASPGERLLLLEAERVLAEAINARGRLGDPDPGEIVTVLTEAGVIAADSPVPGQVAALCRRLDAARPGIAAPPAADIPAEWASVLARRDAPARGTCPEVFAPLAAVLPDVDGTRFALAGLSSAAGASHLHVVGSGVPEPAGRFAHNWMPGFSWWLGDGAGNWHVAMECTPDAFWEGTAAFRLRLAPPLAAIPDAAEVVVTGPTTRVRAVVPVRAVRGRAKMEV